MIKAGAGGERLIARVRLAFFGVLMVVPVVVIWSADEVRREFWIALGTGLVGLAIAALIASVVNRGGYFPGLGFATTAIDISLVTATLVAFAIWGRPIIAVNSMVVWPLYLLFIFASSFRFDPRVTVFAGALSAAQSLAVVLWVNRVWDLSSPDSQYGQLNWPVQIARLVLVLTATALTINIVGRSRSLVFVAGTDVLTGLWNRPAAYRPR